MSIKVQHITKIYGEQKALSDVSFEVPGAQIMGFLGPNGAGKSTMMKILTGYIPQTSGYAEVNGLDVGLATAEVRRNIGYLPESNPLYGDMYVKEYLAFAAGMQGIRSGKDQMAEKAIEMTGLGPERKKKIRMLSKGYKQRVGLAQAIIHNPKVLILDEPTSGLDPNQLLDIRKLIIELGREKTVMLSTHIMQEVEAICERVIIINKGVIAADAPVEQLRQLSGGDVQKIVVEFDKPVAMSSLEALHTVQQVRNLTGNTWEITAATDQDVRSEIFRYAVDHSLTVLTLKKAETSLEEVFHNLTGNRK